MCGIVGYVGKKRVVPVIIDGLKRLEYRGYDSAGIAVAGNGDGLQSAAPKASCAIWKKSSGSSRWTAPMASATRAGPRTAVPPKKMPIRTATAPARSSSCITASSKITLLFKNKLIEEGHKFVTETDTEVIAHLVEKYFIKRRTDIVPRWKKPCARRSGS